VSQIARSAHFRKFTGNGRFLFHPGTDIAERHASNTPRITMPMITAATAA